MQTPSEVAYAHSSSSYNDAVTVLNAVMGSTNGTVRHCKFFPFWKGGFTKSVIMSIGSNVWGWGKWVVG